MSPSRPLLLALGLVLLLPALAAPVGVPPYKLPPLPGALQGLLPDLDKLAVNPGLLDEDWPSYGHDLWGGHFNAAESTLGKANVATLVPKWTSTTGFMYGTVAVWQGRVFVLNINGDVSALDQKTGARLWTTHLGRTATSSPAVANGIVYVTDLGPNAKLYALDAVLGTRLWTSPLSNVASGWGSPVVVGNRVLVGQSGGDDGVSPPHPGSLQAFDALSGRLLWRTTTTSQGHAGGPVWTTPVVLGNLVYVGTGNSFDGIADPGNIAIIAFDLLSGQKVWDTSYPDFGDEDFGASPQIFLANGVPVVGESQKLHYHTVDPFTGDPVWDITYSAPSWVIGTPAVAYGRIYSAGGDSSWWGASQRFTLDVKTGARVEAHNDYALGSLSASAVANGVVYEPETAGIVHAYDADTGAQLWQAQLPGYTYSGAVISHGMLFQGSTGGVVAYGLP